jgi:hypothetical protein
VTRLLIYGGVALALILGAWGYSAYQYRSGKAAGIAQERIAWEEARRKLLAQLEAERRAAQVAIDRIEREYLAQVDRDRKAIESLETIISEMEAGDAGNPGVVGGFPRRLSNHLNQIGR